MELQTTAPAEDIDYILLDQETQRDFHGKYVFLQDNDSLSLFESEQLIGLTHHPISGRELTLAEINYIKFHVACYNYTKDMILAPETLRSMFDWYVKMRVAGYSVENLATNPETTEAYNIVRFYLTATDFESHFRNFNPADTEAENYERQLAEQALDAQKIRGRWLLRHSSRNRSEDPEQQARIKRLGYRYYALSYCDKNLEIGHSLIVCKIGTGWGVIGSWYTNFLDALERVLTTYNLTYQDQVTGYHY